MMSQTGKEIITVDFLRNIWESKTAIRQYIFVSLQNEKWKIIFLKNYAQNVVEKQVPVTFPQK